MIEIKQFYDKGLAHASYAILHDQQIVVIDPARDPQPYIDFAKENEARIIAVIETHPHADFVSSHLELHQITGASIYASQLVGAAYPHIAFDDGDVITIGQEVRLEAINTPGHSPDSICVLLYDETGQPHAIFTGDTLFVGDVGRPDLRGNVGNLTASADVLAKQLYHSTRTKLMTLPENVLVYPAHGPGSLCGKNMGSALYSTIGGELQSNHALQEMGETAFVDMINAGQPFVPRYFEFNVSLNRAGAAPFQESVSQIPNVSQEEVDRFVLIIDGRSPAEFKAGHFKSSYNIPNGGKFETWLGSIVNPEEPFYLVASTEEALNDMVSKIAKIGYEKQLKGTILGAKKESTLPAFELDSFQSNPESYTIVDIRNRAEVAEGKLFEAAIAIPLPELRERLEEIPSDKPIVIHCAGGYRSAIGSSMVVDTIKNVPVWDMSEDVLKFQS